MPKRLIALMIVLLMSLTSIASAWSTKEHILLTRLAVMRLLAEEQTPPAMKDWLRRITPGPLDEPSLHQWYMDSRQGVFPRGEDGAPFWAVVPDLKALTSWPQETVAPWPVGERLLHFIDLEYFDPAQQTPSSKPQYKLGGAAKPELSQIPRDPADGRYKQAGMLPFRIEQVYGKLVRSIRAGRLTDAPGQFPRDEHAAHWAGFLSHYIADNTQPQHSSVDYKSRVFFPPGAHVPNVHAQMEYILVDDERADFPELREQFWQLLQQKLTSVNDEATMDDLWVGSVQTSLRAYDALELVGAAAAAAWKRAEGSDNPSTPWVIDTTAFYNYRMTQNGVSVSLAEKKAELQALAVIRIAEHLRQAWDEAMKAGPIEPSTIPDASDQNTDQEKAG
ncbi:MAG: hypothetical protein IT448_02720 [Phycisphaerales bacterium]|nr:hypothetical protein [Phycisphaerales bacterium]